jgi:hypothetical protein
VSLLVHLSGGHQSVFSFLYIAVTAYGAVLFERRSAVAAASASAFSYGCVLGVEQRGYGFGGGQVHIAVAAATWGVHVGVLFLVGALASVLTNELRATGEALDRSTHDIGRLRDLNARIVQSLNSRRRSRTPTSTRIRTHRRKTRAANARGNRHTPNNLEPEAR